MTYNTFCVESLENVGVLFAITVEESISIDQLPQQKQVLFVCVC